MRSRGKTDAPRSTRGSVSVVLFMALAVFSAEPQSNETIRSCHRQCFAKDASGKNETFSELVVVGYHAPER